MDQTMSETPPPQIGLFLKTILSVAVSISLYVLCMLIAEIFFNGFMTFVFVLLAFVGMLYLCLQLDLAAVYRINLQPENLIAPAMTFSGLIMLAELLLLAL